MLWVELELAHLTNCTAEELLYIINELSIKDSTNTILQPRDEAHLLILLPKSVFGPAKIFPNLSNFNISCSCSSNCISACGGRGRGFAWTVHSLFELDNVVLDFTSLAENRPRKKCSSFNNKSNDKDHRDKRNG